MAPKGWTSSTLPADLLEEILGTVGEGVVVQSHTGEIIASNRAAEIILGLTPDQLHGRTSMDPRWNAVTDDGRPFPGEEHPTMVALRTGEPVDGVLMGVSRPDESQRWIRVSARPIALEGEQMAIVSFTDVTQIREIEGIADHLSGHDTLTGLPNRMMFEQSLEQRVARADRSGTRLGLACFGIDHFSQVNQRNGAMFGDEVLAEVARRIRNAIAPGDFVARIGGDQFAVVIDPALGHAELVQVTQRMQAAVNAPITVGSERFLPSTTFGIASYPLDGDQAGDLFVSAMGALEAAQRTDRGTIAFFSEFEKDPGEHYTSDQSIRRAITDGRVALWYQPIVSMPSLEIVGAEALFRIEGTDVEESSQVLTPEVLGSLGPRIANQVLMLLRRDMQMLVASGGTPPEVVSVNLTAPDLRIPRIRVAVIATALELETLGVRLSVEISEQIGLQDVSDLPSILGELRDVGVYIAIDDFGTGTNSLSLLRELPLNALKLDASFVMGAMDHPVDRAIIKASVTLAKELGLGIVAEGVESQEVLDFVVDQGVTLVQGYLFHRPEPLWES